MSAFLSEVRSNVERCPITGRTQGVCLVPTCKELTVTNTRRENSPAQTPIFPAKKISDPDQPDEWMFVYDLQAVNVTFQQYAPNVPNP